MPTRTGKLKKGDIIYNTKAHTYWRVLERLGNDELYAVRLQPTNPKWWKPDDQRRGYMLMTEAAYWMKNGWELWPRSN